MGCATMNLVHLPDSKSIKEDISVLANDIWYYQSRLTLVKLFRQHRSENTEMEMLFL
jgi:hypothetical protein